ncbi:hypothetical protein AVEN_2200-1, partial [Araneus ventricosus]
MTKLNFPKHEIPLLSLKHFHFDNVTLGGSVMGLLDLV